MVEAHATPSCHRSELVHSGQAEAREQKTTFRESMESSGKLPPRKGVAVDSLRSRVLETTWGLAGGSTVPLAALESAVEFTAMDGDTTAAWREEHTRARKGSPLRLHVPPEPLLTGLTLTLHQLAKEDYLQGPSPLSQSRQKECFCC